MTFTQAAYVFLGGGAGACLRWLLGVACAGLLPAVNAGVLAANLAGCFLIGLAAGFFDARLDVSADLRLLVITGFLGGFTTFSSFSHEMVVMLPSKPAFAVGYMLVKVAACLLLTMAGFWLAARLFGGRQGG